MPNPILRNEVQAWTDLSKPQNECLVISVAHLREWLVLRGGVDQDALRYLDTEVKGAAHLDAGEASALLRAFPKDLKLREYALTAGAIAMFQWARSKGGHAGGEVANFDPRGPAMPLTKGSRLKHVLSHIRAQAAYAFAAEFAAALAAVAADAAAAAAVAADADAAVCAAAAADAASRCRV
jgi:hypothetical protein